VGADVTETTRRPAVAAGSGSGIRGRESVSSTVTAGIADLLALGPLPAT
jgi:hypothetical protein